MAVEQQEEVIKDSEVVMIDAEQFAKDVFQNVTSSPELPDSESTNLKKGDDTIISINSPIHISGISSAPPNPAPSTSSNITPINLKAQASTSKS